MSLAGGSATRSGTLAPEDTDDAVWIAQHMVLEAGVEAARLRRQASARTATICEAAERETEMIWEQASAQAAALREAAEREAAQLRAIVMKLSAGPLANIDGHVAGQEAVGLVGQPGIRRVARPRTRPARRPQGPPRQLVAIRVAAAVTSALVLFASGKPERARRNPPPRPTSSSWPSRPRRPRPLRRQPSQRNIPRRAHRASQPT